MSISLPLGAVSLLPRKRGNREREREPRERERERERTERERERRVGIPPVVVPHTSTRRVSSRATQQILSFLRSVVPGKLSDTSLYGTHATLSGKGGGRRKEGACDTCAA